MTGGTNGDRVYGPSFDYVHAFDISTGAWAQIQSSPAPGLPPRFAHAAAVLGGEIVIFGEFTRYLAACALARPHSLPDFPHRLVPKPLTGHSKCHTKLPSSDGMVISLDDFLLAQVD